MDYLFIATILICGILDLKTRTIPNKITIPLIFLCLIYQIIHGQVKTSIVGLTIGLGIGLLSFTLNSMGGGDVKLMAAMGAWLGPFPFLYVLFTGSLISIFWGLFLFLRQKFLTRNVKGIASRFTLGYYNDLKFNKFIQNNQGENRYRQSLTIPFGACLSIALLYINIFPIRF